jgi:Mg2+-importing ATPase
MSEPQGLASADARRRLTELGPNEPAPPQHVPFIRHALSLFSNPLVLILLLASGVSATLGEIINAAIIVVIVLLSVSLNFVQTYRSQQAVDRLRQTVAPTATALRDGQWREVARRDLVPDDVIRLTAGDLVPADATLLEARDLHVQEAALTGESLPVEKIAHDPRAAPAQDDQQHKVFLGTSVVSGVATAVVTATGPRTVFGDIAARLSRRPPETEFERGTRQFGLFITRIVFFMVLFVFVVSAALRHNPLESLLFAVALAVGLTPELLPVITTVTLARGAVHMARQKVIVKHLEAIQNFGSADILCSDKTGTLTSGDMVLDQYLDPLGRSSERVLLLAYLNSAHETGIENPLDEAILKARERNPLDVAVLRHDHPDAHAYRKIDEVPFDFDRRCVSIVVEANGERLLISKGAPESVLARCVTLEADGQSSPFDAAARQRCDALYQRLSAQGYRTLAVAHKTVPAQAAYGVEDEQGLTLAGFLTFADPPRADAAETLRAMRRDGVLVKILTGDNELVTRHVCAEVGLDASRIVLGSEVEQMTDPALAATAEQTAVFARVSPGQKTRIILALKSRGHVVGFLGDGINDAPSLHAADVGISVASGVDVAKDAADIILLERGLDVLHSGIIEGRKAFGNVMKYLLMGTSSNFGNMFSMAAASVFLPFLPMLPTQILLNNFLYDAAQISIPTDNVDPTFIQKPRRWRISLIRDFMLFIGPISSIYDFLTFGALLTIFRAREPLFHTGWFVESLATQTLVLFVIRTAGNPLRSRPSLPLVVTTLVMVAVGIALPYTPAAPYLGFVPLPAGFFVFLAAATGTYLVVVEMVKRRLLGRLFD